MPGHTLGSYVACSGYYMACARHHLLYPKQHYKLVLLLICPLNNKVYSDTKTQVTQNESVLVFSYSSTHLVKCTKDYIRAQILAVMSRVLSKAPHQKDTEFVIKLILPNLQKL